MSRNPENCYYKIDQAGRKRYYRRLNDTNISVKSIKNPDQVEFEPYTYYLDLEKLRSDLAGLQFRIQKFKEWFDKYQIKLELIDEYKKRYYNRKASCKNDKTCYIKLSINDSISYYSYKTDKLVAKHNVRHKERFDSEESIKKCLDPYPLIADYNNTLKEIEKTQNRIQTLQEKIEGLNKTREELHQEYEARKAQIQEKIDEEKRKQQEERDRVMAERMDRERIYLVSITNNSPNNQRPNNSVQTFNQEDEGTENEEIQCKICMDHKNKIVINCGHLMCVTCYNQIIQNTRKCPNCRVQIISGTLVYF